MSLVAQAVLRLRSSRGQTMAEYALLVAVIAIVVIVAATVLGSNTSSVLNRTAGYV